MVIRLLNRSARNKRALPVILAAFHFAIKYCGSLGKLLTERYCMSYLYDLMTHSKSLIVGLCGMSGVGGYKQRDTPHDYNRYTDIRICHLFTRACACA